MIELTGKTVLITGASRGIGAVTAKTLHQAGATVVMHYGFGKAEAEVLTQEMGAAGRDRLALLQADLALPDGARRLWESAIALHPHIDILINNAATMPAAPLDSTWDTWTTAWQTTLQVNLLSVADLCRIAICHYQSRGGGILINLASRAAFRGDSPEFMPYAASKGGVISLTRTIARGFAKDRVLAYAIAPGFVRTDRIEEVMQERGAEYVTRDIPMGAPAEPQDVANLIAFLAAGLAPHATGATFDVNGASYFH